MDLDENKSNDGKITDNDSSDCESSSIDFDSENDSDDADCPCQERIFNNEECTECNRYILKPEQKNWDFDRIFSGCIVAEIVADPGADDEGICKECEDKMNGIEEDCGLGCKEEIERLGIGIASSMFCCECKRKYPDWEEIDKKERERQFQMKDSVYDNPQCQTCNRYILTYEQVYWNLTDLFGEDCLDFLSEEEGDHALQCHECSYKEKKRNEKENNSMEATNN